MGKDKHLKNTGINACLMHLVLISLFSPQFGKRTSYDEITSLGVNCSPKDTCSVRRHPSDDNLLQSTCECKPSCARYRTCCVDSRYNRYWSQNMAHNPESPQNDACHTLFGTPSAVLAKTTCKEWWYNHNEVKSLCESDVRDLRDPISVLPVTNPTTLRTYKNYFCALCNDDARNIVLWSIEISKPLTPWSNSNVTYDKETALQDLVYNDRTEQWGFTSSSSHERVSQEKIEDTYAVANDEDFVPAYVLFKEPSSLDGRLQKCDPDLISDCHPNWNDETVRRKCRSYMSMIYAYPNTSEEYPRLERFRNVHCAICNFAGENSKFYCAKSVGYGGRPSLSFSLLLDINTADGDRVGVVNRCKSGEMYDPFFKKCRSMLCVKPGHVVKGGKCERL